MRRLLLISNSTLHGSGYLDHCAGRLASFLGQRVRRVLFVPFAQHDRRAYTEKTRARFERMGFALDSLHDSADMPGAVASAEALFIGGGNTFRLLHDLYAHDLLVPIRDRVRSGMPYIGSSAGTGVACITIKTTNDMPIVEPPSFDALALVPFNVNAHYLDPVPDSTHMGETREQRIREFHELNDPPVVGLREGAMLMIEAAQVTLQGSTGARIFRKGREPEEFLPGARLDFLLGR